MITTPRKEYYWLGMKKDVAGYLARCLECQQIKAEHQHPAGLLQPLSILEWKWETISMDFITGLPKSKKNNDSIMDKLSKSAHFIPATQDRQKNFADRKRRFKEYQVGDHVYVRIRAKKSTLQWSGCAKLAPRYCGPFQILARIGPVAYQLTLPSHIRVHNVLHVSVLKKYVYDPKYVIKWQDIQVEPEGELRVELLSILNRREVTLWKQDITQVKVQWQYFGPDEATWEDEELMKRTYPGLFIAERH
eukprot:PITA_13472